MMAAWHQIPRIRAERMLEGVQIQSAQHMKQRDHRAFIDRLVEQAVGIVEDVAAAGQREVVHWNGKALSTARAIKGRFQTWEREPESIAKRLMKRGAA